MEDTFRVRLPSAPKSGAALRQGHRASSHRSHRPAGHSKRQKRTHKWIKLGGKVKIFAFSRRFDAGKKIKGRKRHIVTDTQGHMLPGIVHEASIQDRDGAPRVIGFACESFPTVTHIFADSGYAGEKLEAALAKMNGPAIVVVKRPDGAKGFVQVAKRWVVERTLSSIAVEVVNFELDFIDIVRHPERRPAPHLW